MKFRPCIDLHNGQVKQIVGSSLQDELVTNFVAERPASWFAELYKADGLDGGHVIQLGAGNTEAAGEALAAWPEGLQIGGGVNETNAKSWIDQGASAVIVTSAVFREGVVDWDRLEKIKQAVGAERLVLDLSCRLRGGDYYIVTDLWTRYTEIKIEPRQLDLLAAHCGEFLIHAVDVEGKGLGVDAQLLQLLGDWGGHPMTYAGGVHSYGDIETVKQAGDSKIDFTVGSGLDIFGGKGLLYQDLVQTNSKGF